MAEIGAVIENKYEILTEIGRGGMSVVYLAMDRRLNKQWAVKEIKKQVNNSYNDIVIQSLITESNLMKKLDHPALPRIVDIIDDGSTIYIVMDYIEGTSLDRVLDERGAIGQDTVIEWAKQLCDALNYLHGRTPPIIYRDMKPANVMLKPEGTLKIIDFGIAREFKEYNIADTVCLGTKGYAAPEQFGGQGQTDARTDIYSLGVTLYQLITGKNPTEPPYEIYPIRYWNPSLSVGLENIILKCTQLNPDDRYQNCSELMYALNHYEEIDGRYIRRQKRKVFACAAALTVTILSLAAGTYFNYAADKNKSYNYNQLMADAEKEVDFEKREQMYIDAIDVRPEMIDAYEGLISLYKQNDSRFTSDEANVLVGLVNQHQEELRNIPNDYVQLCYDIGKLYWFHYDYGNTDDNQITRVKSAIPWFDDVVTYCESGEAQFESVNMAIIFRNIGIFNRDYSINIREASGKGTYIEHFNQLRELAVFLEENPDEDEIVIWEAYKIIVYSLETYMQKFKSDDVALEDISALCETVRNATQNLDATDDITIEIKEYIDHIINENSGTLNEKIQAAYY